MKMPRYIPKYDLRYNIDSFKHDSVKDLYERRLASKSKENGIEEDDVDIAWEKVKTNITKVAQEILGQKKSISPVSYTHLDVYKRQELSLVF